MMIIRKLRERLQSTGGTQRNSKRKSKRRIAFEQLHRRELMAADGLGVELDPSTYLIAGTSGNDNFTFSAGAVEHTLTLNGETETIPVDQYDNIIFQGDDGDDKVVLAGTTADELGVINTSDASLTNGAWTVNVEDIKEVDMYGGGGNDSVTLNDSEDNDRFKAYEDRAQIYGDGFNHEAFDFTNVVANSSAGSDRAYMYGTDGSDYFFGNDADSSMATSNGTHSTANDFARVYSYSYGGLDYAQFTDSAGDDVYKSTKTYATLDTLNTYVKAHDFEMTTAHAINGGYDKAYQYDTRGSELLIVSDEAVRMLGEEFDTEAVGFERNYSYSRNGGDDYVRVYDAIFDDDFDFETLFEDTGRKNGLEIATDFTRFFSGNFYRKAEGFIVSEVLETNPRYLVGEVENGVVDVNIDWIHGQADQYYIELQRYGAELIVAGLGIDNVGMIDEGIEVIQWGLDQQAADGSFPGTGDPVHSTSLFLHAVGMSIEELDRFQYDAFDASTRAQWIDGLERMSLWMVSVDQDTADIDLEPFAHRYFLRAVGLKKAAALTGNATLDIEADAYLAEGLTKMTADGIMPERGGFDINYQTLGLKYLGEFFRMSATTAQQDAIRAIFEASLVHIESRIDADGNVDMTDSTRSNEEARNGSMKTFDTKNAVRAYLCGFEITGNEAWLTLATAIFQHDSSQA